MKEIKGELWDFYGKPNTIICVTTNGFVKHNGRCVMGRGCAKEAMLRCPGIDKLLGTAILAGGNKVYELEYEQIWSFPVKHNWWETADLQLIRKSALYLKTQAENRSGTRWILPRPGCGNGHLAWTQVRPLLEDLPDNVLVITR